MSTQPVQLIDLAANITSVKRVHQHIRHALRADLTIVATWKIWLGAQKAQHLSLRLKPPHGKAFHRLYNMADEQLIGDQKLPMAVDRLIAIAHWRIMHPIALLHTRLHFLPNLPPVLLALQSALGSHDGPEVLDQHPLAIFGNVHTFQQRQIRPPRAVNKSGENQNKNNLFQSKNVDDYIRMLEG